MNIDTTRVKEIKVTHGTIEFSRKRNRVRSIGFDVLFENGLRTWIGLTRKQAKQVKKDIEKQFESD